MGYMVGKYSSTSTGTILFSFLPARKTRRGSQGYHMSYSATAFPLCSLMQDNTPSCLPIYSPATVHVPFSPFDALASGRTWGKRARELVVLYTIQSVTHHELTTI